MKTSKSRPAENQSDTALADPILLDSQQQPAWHVVVLSFFTLGAYNMYWLYRNLNSLCQGSNQLQQGIDGKDPELEDAHIKLGRDGTLETYLKFGQARPIFTTALFAIPVVNLLVLLGFAHMSAQLIPDRNSFMRKNSQFTGFVIALLFGALTLLIRLPEPFELLYLTSALPLAIVQIWLNRHWKVVEDNKRIARQAFSPLELVAIITGASIIGLIAIHPDIK
ncbi:DUF4234 domain-containing protein [bacterium]|nr:DUF4234 domain-containing protein [bacterium]MBP9810082.1 DUF4234 domain-containing protein [bacterium]